MASEATSGQLAEQFDAWLALTAPRPDGDRSARPAVVRLPMRTGSMHPALPRGCTLLIAPVAGAPARAAAAQPGAVVVFARDGRLTAHRVLRRARRDGGPSVLEMGDANPAAEWRPLAEVVGLVLGAESADGSPLPPPSSRRRAWRLRLRLAKARLRGLVRRGRPNDRTGPEAP